MSFTLPSTANWIMLFVFIQQDDLFLCLSASVSPPLHTVHSRMYIRPFHPRVPWLGMSICIYCLFFFCWTPAWLHVHVFNCHCGSVLIGPVCVCTCVHVPLFPVPPQVLLGEVNAGLNTTQVVVKELKVSASVQDQMHFLEEAQPYG